jgi:hypothetical protein
MKTLRRLPVLLACGFAAGRALRSSTWRSGVGCLALLSLAACNLPAPQADPVRHFTLSAPAAAAPVAQATQVRPVQLAGHLHGRAMAVRVAEHEVVYLDEVRWAESLDEAITQLLRARLGVVPGGATVSVDVLRCELDRAAGNTVQLSVSYTIVPADGPKSAAYRGNFSATPRAWDGRDYSVLVGLMSQAVGDLGDALAAAVEKK